MTTRKRFISAILVLVIALSAITPFAAAASYPTVRLGSRGSTVVTLQTMLNSTSGAGLTVDGIFGANTQTAVKNFQRSSGLTVDGIVGAKTWSALQTAYNNVTASKAAQSSSYASTASQVITYSVKKDGNTMLSANFKVLEFRCKDGSDTVLIDAKLVALLQDIRDHFGKAVIINSAYRTASHNKSVGGASNSYHLYGRAADIRISGVAPSEIAKYAESLGVKGIGLYDTFVHVDTRETKYYWRTTGSGKTTAVSTFS